ncbi:MAG: hypothetical protein ACM3ML_29410 [Micromonosporaceae bacterium]
MSAFYVDLDDRYVSRAGFDDLGGRAIGRASLHFDGLEIGDGTAQITQLVMARHLLGRAYAP